MSTPAPDRTHSRIIEANRQMREQFPDQREDLPNHIVVECMNDDCAAVRSRRRNKGVVSLGKVMRIAVEKPCPDCGSPVETVWPPTDDWERRWTGESGGKQYRRDGTRVRTGSRGRDRRTPEQIAAEPAEHLSDTADVGDTKYALPAGRPRGMKITVANPEGNGVLQVLPVMFDDGTDMVELDPGTSGVFERVTGGWAWSDAPAEA